MIEKLLIGAGAMKAGTTWLYKQLESHPGIHFTPEKEIHYFSQLGHKLTHKKRLDKYHRLQTRSKNQSVIDWYHKYSEPEHIDDVWYSSLFEGVSNEVYCADFSNQYCLLPESELERIANIAKEVKIIYTLRDPLERLWSHVKFQYKYIGEEDKVDDIGLKEFRQLVNKPWFWKNTQYVENHNRLVSVFGKNNVRIFYLEDFIAFPQGSLWNLEKFLNIDHVDISSEAANEKVNKTKEMVMPEKWKKMAQRKLQPVYEEIFNNGLNHPSWRF